MKSKSLCVSNLLKYEPISRNGIGARDSSSAYKSPILSRDLGSLNAKLFENMDFLTHNIEDSRQHLSKTEQEVNPNPPCSLTVHSPFESTTLLFEHTKPCSVLRLPRRSVPCASPESTT